LGHYTLPKVEGKTFSIEKSKQVPEATIIGNGEYKLATVPLYGWDKTSVHYPVGLHPVSNMCSLIMSEKAVNGEHIVVTLHLWKKGEQPFSKKELCPVKEVKVADDLSSVEIVMTDKSTKIVKF
jgi:hypothetical protein